MLYKCHIEWVIVIWSKHTAIAASTKASLLLFKSAPSTGQPIRRNLAYREIKKSLVSDIEELTNITGLLSMKGKELSGFAQVRHQHTSTLKRPSQTRILKTLNLYTFSYPNLCLKASQHSSAGFERNQISVK